MNFNELVDLAFTRGVGMRRLKMLTSVHFYEDLLAKIGSTEYAVAVERAEMVFLGERLADEAFKSLPSNLQEKAELWATQSHSERRETAKALLSELTTARWAELRGIDPRSAPKKPVIDEALPRMYGSWESGPTQPNCLGMAQMLVGFGRATGSRVILIDTIRRFDRTFITDMYRMISALTELLERHSHISHLEDVRKDLESHAEPYLKDIQYFTEYDQAHHAVMIESDDGRWLVVDVYMDRCYTYDDERDRLYEELTDIGNCDAKSRHSFDTHVSEKLQNACEMIDILLNLFSQHINSPYQEDDYDRILEMIKVITDYVHTEKETIRKFRQKLAPEEEIPSEPRIDIMLQLLEKIFGELLLPEELEIVKTDAVKVFDYLPKIAERSADKCTRDEVIARMAREYVKTAVNQLFAEYNPLNIHSSVEMSHAEFHLATTTLNHLAAATESDNSQIVLLDPLSQHFVKDLLFRDEVSNSQKVKDMVEYSLRSFGALPEYAVSVDLLPYLDQTGESNG